MTTTMTTRIELALVPHVVIHIRLFYVFVSFLSCSHFQRSVLVLSYSGEGKRKKQKPSTHPIKDEGKKNRIDTLDYLR